MEQKRHMRDLRILVFPCGSEIGLELHRSLCFAKEIQLYGAGSIPDHGRFVYDHYIGDVPYVTEPRFSAAINKIIADHGIDYVIPAHDSAVYRLAQMQDCGAIGCCVVTSTFETCRILRSKRQTMEWFSHDVRTPELYDDIHAVPNFPAFLKPDVGQGSRGTAIARSKDEAQFYLAGNPDLLVMEYLPGDEYTVDCYTNKVGDLIFAGCRRRCRISNGISVNAVPVDDSRIKNIVSTINCLLEISGMWFCQFKESCDGRPVLMEAAPRIAGTAGLHRSLGVNLALMNIYELEGYDVAAMPNTFGIEMDRALCSRFKLTVSYRHVYVDLDDCLVINRNVHTALVAFLYQCVNDGVQLHLITRHQDAVQPLIDQMRLSGLFDSLIHLRHGEKKSDYVRHRESIFIDDSFSERADVHTACKIPVFAPDAVECLIR